MIICGYCFIMIALAGLILFLKPMKKGNENKKGTKPVKAKRYDAVGIILLGIGLIGGTVCMLYLLW